MLLPRLPPRYFGTEARGSIYMQVLDRDMLKNLDIGAGEVAVFAVAFFPSSVVVPQGLTRGHWPPRLSRLSRRLSRIHSQTRKRKKKGILPKKRKYKRKNAIKAKKVAGAFRIDTPARLTETSGMKTLSSSCATRKKVRK